MTSLTPAAQVLLSLIPIVGIVASAVILFFTILWRHRENKLRMIQHTYKEPKINLQVFSLLTGLCLTGIGIVLTLIFALIQGLSYSLLGGLVPLALGIMFIIFYKLNPNFKNNKSDEEWFSKEQRKFNFAQKRS